LYAARTIAALALVRAAAAKPQATPDDLNFTATAFVMAQPSSSRTATLAVAWGQAQAA